MSEKKVLENLKTWINKCRGNIGKEAILDKIAELEDTAGYDETEENSILNKSILDEDLGLTVRATWCLRNAGVRTLGDLTTVTKDEFLSTRVVGRKSLSEIEDMLTTNGLSFKDGKA